MTKAVALIALLVLQFGATMFGFMYGWGLSVSSWPALITSWLMIFFISVGVEMVKAE
jgi:hypothetical protein